jgi:glycosyltransferase involved in cell wall biosynthesis
MVKVFCGYVNTGGIAYKIAEGLRRNGIKADSVVIDDHSFSYPFHKKLKYAGNKPGFINRLIKYYYFIKHTLMYDVFIFNTRSTMLARKGDLKILKKLGKKTAMVYVGCDIRDKNFYLNSSEKYTVCKNCTEAYQKKIVCVMEDKHSESATIQKYIDAPFSHPFDAMILNGNFNYLYLLLELEKYVPEYEINRRVKIVHIPSDDGIKGTTYVLEAIEKLKKENIEFDFELIRNKPHNEVVEIIRNSDILIDQMVAGWYGLISVEAMALGKTTVCFLRDKLYEYIPDIPIINLNPDNLAEGLKKLVAERERLIEYGRAGRKYAEKYHDYIKNSLDMLKITMGEKVQEGKIN